MRVRLTVGLIDRPGMLLKVLEQIALYGGNIISIIHNRDRITEGYVPVSINIDFPDEESLERAKAGIESLGMPVMGTETLEKRVETIILVGNVGVEKMTRFFEETGAKLSGLTLAGNPQSPCMKLVVEMPLDKRLKMLESLKKLVAEAEGLVVCEAEL